MDCEGFVVPKNDLIETLNPPMAMAVEMDAGCGNKRKGVARAWLRE